MPRTAIASPPVAQNYTARRWKSLDNSSTLGPTRWFASRTDPRAELAEAGEFRVGLFGLQTVFRLDVVTKIAVASITVPLVEELFWRPR